MQRWADFAAKRLTTEIVEKAQSLARQQMAQSDAIVRHDTASAVAFGSLAPSEAALPLPKQLEELHWRHLILEMGQALSMVNDDVSAARVLGATARRFTVDPSHRRAAAAAAHPDFASDARARHFERELFTCWGTALSRLGEDVMPLYALAVQRGLWKSPLQRPLDHCAPHAMRSRSAHIPALAPELPATRPLGPLTSTAVRR
jgi:hypothetical protein